MTATEACEQVGKFEFSVAISEKKTDGEWRQYFGELVAGGMGAGGSERCG